MIKDAIASNCAMVISKTQPLLQNARVRPNNARIGSEFHPRHKATGVVDVNGLYHPLLWLAS
jgi:hypothetical protein